MHKKLILFFSFSAIILLGAGCNFSSEIDPNTTNNPTNGNTNTTTNNTTTVTTGTNGGSPDRVSINLSGERFDFTPSVIRVKKGQTVELKLTAKDVAHGLSIPAFNVRKDFSPGKEETVAFVADQTGTFEFRCSVYCGEDHGEMKGTIIVEE